MIMCRRLHRNTSTSARWLVRRSMEMISCQADAVKHQIFTGATSEEFFFCRNKPGMLLKTKDRGRKLALGSRVTCHGARASCPPLRAASLCPCVISIHSLRERDAPHHPRHVKKRCLRNKPGMLLKTKDRGRKPVGEARMSVKTGYLSTYYGNVTEKKEVTRPGARASRLLLGEGPPHAPRKSQERPSAGTACPSSWVLPVKNFFLQEQTGNVTENKGTRSKTRWRSWDAYENMVLMLILRECY